MAKSRWTKELCLAEALKYNSRKELHNGIKSGYSVANKNGWLNEICKHMVVVKAPNYFYTKKRCARLALKCKTRTEFDYKYQYPCRISRENGWLDEICSHMVRNNRIWTKESITKVISKYLLRNTTL